MPGKVCVSWGGRRVRRQAATRIIVAVLVPHLLGLLLLRLLLRGHRAAERGEHASTRREPGSEGEGARGPVSARSDGGGKLGGASCMTRGRGRRPRPVARSQTREDHIRRNGRRVAKLSATVRLGLHSLGVVEAGVSVNHTPQTRPPGRCAPRRRRRGERRARSGASASGSDFDSRSASRGGGSISI